MKTHPIVIIIGIAAALLGLAVIAIILYFALGIKEGSTANPGGLIAGATLLWASIKTKILKLSGGNLLQFANVSAHTEQIGTIAPKVIQPDTTAEQQRLEQERLEQQRLKEIQQRKAAERRKAEKMEQARLKLRKVKALYEYDVINLDTIKSAMSNKDYEVYDTAATGTDRPVLSNGINIVGIRNNNTRPNSFDDAIVVFWKPEGRSQWEFRRYKATTDPGAFYLGNGQMGNENGTAILKENQYPGVYKIGKHRGAYTALTQAEPMTVIRDNNRDDLLDFGSDNFFEGRFGINIHRSNPRTESKQVNKWSAGCQVFAKKAEWDEFIDHCQTAAKKYGQNFTYTLLNVEDVIQAVV
jgi:hypothetical protein